MEEPYDLRNRQQIGQAAADQAAQQRSLSAINQGLKEVDEGMGITLDEFDRQIRERFGFASSS